MYDFLPPTPPPITPPPITPPTHPPNLVCIIGVDSLFVCGSQDQTISLCRLVGVVDGTPSIVLLHQCKGHSQSIEDLDVCRDRSKVRGKGVLNLRFRARLVYDYTVVL